MRMRSYDKLLIRSVPPFFYRGPARFNDDYFVMLHIRLIHVRARGSAESVCECRRGHLNIEARHFYSVENFLTGYYVEYIPPRAS